MGYSFMKPSVTSFADTLCGYSYDFQGCPPSHAIWWLVCVNQISSAGTSNYIPHIMWDVIICPCPDTLFRFTQVLIHTCTWQHQGIYTAYVIQPLHISSYDLSWPISQYITTVERSYGTTRYYDIILYNNDMALANVVYRDQTTQTHKKTP